MKVFVAGATGVLGRRAVVQLVAAGHDVRGVARSDDKAARLVAVGATPVRVDLFDADAVAAAAAGSDAVVNLATHIPEVVRAARTSAWVENDRIRTEASTNLADAAMAAGAARFVQESITFTYPDRGDAWIDETVPIDPSPGIESVLAAEANAARVSAAGAAGVVLRFAFFYAADSHHTQMFVTWARRGVGPTAGRPGAYLSSIHADDAAAAVVAALGVEPGVYNVADDEPVTRRDLARILGRAVGRRHRVHLPGRLAALGGKRAQPMVRSQRIANGRFRDATGWAPQYPSVRVGLPVEVARFQADEDRETPASSGEEAVRHG